MFRTAVLVIVLMVFVLNSGKAQDHSFVYYDSITYRLYQEKDYQSLLNTGSEAINLGYEGYYLSVRTGIAAFELKKYRVAADYFERAKVYSDNDMIKEYLYYSYLWGGQKSAAQNIEGTMTEDLRNKLIGLGKNNLSVDLNGSVLFKTGEVPENQEFPTEEGFQVIPDHFISTSLSLKHRLGWNVNLTHMFTWLNKGNQKYSYTNAVQLYDSSFNSNQFQYYLGSEILLNRSWSLNLGFHFSSVSFPGVIVDTTSKEVHLYDTAYRIRDFVLSASVTKDFKWLSLEGELVLLNLNRNLTLQPSFIVRLYPLANLNFYTQSRFSLLVNNHNASFFQQQKVGFKVLNRLWLEGSWFSGSVSGFALNNGSLLFNGLEEVNSMWSADAIITVNPDLLLTFGYQFRKQSNYFFPQSGTFDRSNKIELNYSLFYIRLSWAF